jgi:ABC-2 type transport system permease protein
MQSWTWPGRLPRSSVSPSVRQRWMMCTSQGPSGKSLTNASEPAVNPLSAVHGIVIRDLTRTARQTSRLIGGVARPFMWLLRVGAGFNAIARVDSGLSYQAFIYPGIVVMAALFGAMLMAISTVYDREFGILRLMLASPAGTGAVLTGRALAAALVGLIHGAIVLAFSPFFVAISPENIVAALGALCLGAAVSSVLGLLVAARLSSVENFAGVINVVLFPLLFVSGALYPTAGMPAPLRLLALINPVTYQVDLMRHAFSQPAEFTVFTDLVVLIGAAAVLFALTALLFDPEQRFIGQRAKPS